MRINRNINVLLSFQKPILQLICKKINRVFSVLFLAHSFPLHVNYSLAFVSHKSTAFQLSRPEPAPAYFTMSLNFGQGEL